MSLPAIPDRGGPPALPPGMCPLCGADTSPGQEYCLECGERLVATPQFTGEAVAQMLPFTRRSWFWPGIVGFLVTAITVVAVLFSGVLHKKAPVVNATTPFITVSVSHTTTAPAATVAAPRTTPGKTTPATPHSSVLSEWPTSRSSGYTIVLASLPAAGGRAQALALAHRALSSGLTQVGILDSKRFASLHPGYFVVFSGIYDSASAANSALSQVRANGFNAAYEREVSR